IKTALTYKNSEQLMFVVGATRPEFFKEVRELIPNYFLLVPGVGAQGGTIDEVCKYGLTKNVGLLINSTRDIIYASSGLDFAEKAKEKAMELQAKMGGYLSEL
ncbi:MAG: orotidine 5'-phosphate decarboxylase, partial [Flavobacteriales bacterium CG_4_8_14_3_um_filter_35_10]